MLEAVEDVSRGNRKIPQSEFLADGRLAVVDQGRPLIAGYTYELEAAVAADGPLIVFGDHTRALKYVDFPFAMGADGVKVLKVREGFDAKFVYHYLSSRPIPNAGYSRHFKYLKEIEVPKPSMSEQRRIAAILDHADALRAKRRKVLARLEDLTQAIFHEMFGGHRDELVTLGDVVSAIENGTSPNCETRPADLQEWAVLKLGAVTYGVFDELENKAFVGEVGSMIKNEVRPGDVLMTRKNTRELVGAVALVGDAVRGRLLLPDLIFRLRLDEERLNPRYFHALMSTASMRAAVRSLSSGSAASMPNISKSRLRALALPVPGLPMQAEFARRVETVARLRGPVASAMEADDDLFASLQARAFRGEL